MRYTAGYECADKTDAFYNVLLVKELLAQPAFCYEQIKVRTGISEFMCVHAKDSLQRMRIKIHADTPEPAWR